MQFQIRVSDLAYLLGVDRAKLYESITELTQTEIFATRFERDITGEYTIDANVLTVDVDKLETVRPGATFAFKKTL